MTITLHQALETLSRLQSAAPAQTAGKLGEIGVLLQSLADENTYLSTLLLDELPPSNIATIEAAPSRPAAPSPAPSDDLRVQDGAAEAWLSGMNEALRPPLVAIRGRAELVQAGLLGQITPEQDQWLQAIQENTDRAFGVMDAVQELRSLQKGQMRIETVNFISTDLLKEAWERIRDTAKVLNHEIIIQAPDAVPLTHGDFYHSLIILTDLLDNALYYTPPGGQIRMSVDDLGTHVLFTVADNGIGLTPEDLDSVGQAFWRGSQRLVRQHSGSGLRLHLAKQVLELLNGELIFSGEPALGSTFSFTLPIPE